MRSDIEPLNYLNYIFRRADSGKIISKLINQGMFPTESRHGVKFLKEVVPRELIADIV